MRAVVMLVAALLIAACEQEATDVQLPPQARPVAWTEVVSADQRQLRFLPGVVRPVDRTALGFEVSGRITAINVNDGDDFGVGDILATLESDNYEITLAERDSALQEARASLREAQAGFNRQAQLFQEGWVSRSAYDTALAAQETAEATVRRLRNSLQRAQEDLDDTVLYAPYDGSVSERLGEPSQIVGAGQAVFQIQSDGSGIEVEVSVPETLIGGLQYGTSHAISFPSQRGLTLTGTISEIGSDASSANAFTVTLMVPDAPTDMRTGLTAEVALDMAPPAQAEPDSVLVPIVAIQAGSGRADLDPDEGRERTPSTGVVFVIDEAAGVVRQRQITAWRASGQLVSVSGGLQVGEKIVTRGAAFLNDGQAVQLLGVGPRRYNP
jgi:RND family efflux transporter MFP subunit